MEGTLFMEWGVFKVRVGQAKGIGRVHYFWDRALLCIGMGE